MSAAPAVRAHLGHGRLLLTASADRPSAWLPLAGALALADALRAVARVPAEVAWPAAVTIQGAACGGAAGVRRTGEVSVAGLDVEASLSLTVSMLEAPSGWTSVLSEGGDADADAITAAFESAFAHRAQQLVSDPAALAADYRAACVTVGRRVQVDGAPGIVTGVDAEARLLVEVDGVERVWDGAPPV